MIGQKLWKYDCNRRHYKRDDGTTSTGPIYIKSFEELEVIGETSRSWLVGHNRDRKEGPPAEWELERATKIPKKESFESHGYFTSWKAVEDSAWVHDNDHIIATKVGRLSSRDKLERILKIIEET